MTVVSDQQDITKDDLPTEVAEYITALEDLVSTQDGTIEKADQEVLDLKAQLEAVTKSDDGGRDDGDDEKSLLEKADPALRAHLSKQADELKAAREEIRKERDEREQREFIAKAAALPNISGSDQEIADVLHKIHKFDPELAETVEVLFTAANEQIEKSDLFSETGVSGADTVISKSIEARVKEIRKAKPELTAEQAETMVYEESPELYSQLIQEMN